MSNDDRIDKSKADPEILRAYQDMRNERRAGNYLLPMALGGKGVFFLTFIIMMLAFPDSSGYTKAYAVLGVSGFYLLTCLTLMVVWSGSGKRLRTLGIIVVFLGICAVLVALMSAFMDWVIAR